MEVKEVTGFTLEILKNTLEEDENLNGLIVLLKLEEFVKPYARNYYKKAILFLLTQDPKRFKSSKDPEIKELFGDCSYQKLQLLVQWAQYLKEVIPVNYLEPSAVSSKESTTEVEKVVKFKMPDPTIFRKNKYLNHKTTSIKENFNMRYEPPSKLKTSESSSKSENSYDWLRGQYEKYQKFISHLTWENFYKYIITTLSTKSNETLQNDLFDMFGFECFDLIQSIMDKRDQILNGASINSTGPQNHSALHTSKILTDKKKKSPALTKQVIVQSEEEKQLEKQMRKIAKKMVKQKNLAYLNNYEQVEQTLDVVKHEPIFKPTANLNREQYDHVHDEQKAIYQKAVICGKHISIPFDAKRNINKKYEEIIIPARPKNNVATVTRIQINDLDIIGKMVFKNVESFNDIQSEVYPTAYFTNENMLISAPTGAGKTNIALMTVVHQIKHFIVDNVVQLDKFKIVYVCPMKALAAEMVNNFSKRLSCLGIVVKELTGDIQLSRKEIMETQMLIVTPEKWDIITRKGTADAELTSLLKLLIIDEIHLLNTDRGPVIEALVARTLRQVVTSQNMIRIVGLSATLPNYLDVASFLRVDPSKGLYYFDGRYRSVPLEQTFIGVKSTKSESFTRDMNEICFDKVLEFVKKGQQVMVFVTARNETVRTANFFKEMATQMNVLKYFQPENNIKAKKAAWSANSNMNRATEDLLPYGLGVHHAGMLRSHRNAVEKYFLDGVIKCLVCTATLAWGVNLPAHAVIIKGTSIYDSKRSAFVDMDILDVLQIFGRAGRPQYDTSGSGIIMTSEEKLNHYLQALTNQLPIESKLPEALSDHLNAEIVLGTVANIQEAVEWLTFTYFYKRVRTNPLVYGLTYSDFHNDPDLREYLLLKIHNSATQLDKAHMIRYDVNVGDLIPTNFGRTASYYYINYDTMVIFNEMITSFMQESEIIQMMCYSAEFRQIQVRPEELDELERLVSEYCMYPCPPVTESIGKICALMQTYISRGSTKALSLSSDMFYITQNASRIARALFDIALNLNQAVLAAKCLIVAQMFERQVWVVETPLRQFPNIPEYVYQEIERRHIDFLEFKEMDNNQIKHIIKSFKSVDYVKQCAEAFPDLTASSTIHPITRGVIRIKLTLIPNFQWFDKFHGKACEIFWIWVENPDNNDIYHSESCTFTKKMCMNKEPLDLVFTIQLIEPRPSQYLIQIQSDRWLNAYLIHPLPLRDVVLPESFTPHTDLLELTPLHVSVLSNARYEQMYNFTHFNPVQTQIFHCLYHTDNNVLLGAPTGSGKTIAAELCIFRLLNKNPELKVVYIAPLKALVRERVDDWKVRFGKILNKRVIEVTADVSPSAKILNTGDIFITTPEKWDGMSRGWQNRGFIRDVGLLIIDEIHLLGEDRGPVLEIIVSRTNFISERTGRKLRIVGLSTAMANAGDLASWLQIKEVGLYNFRPTVRPVPIEVHITGFPGKHYCPRMISMNRPAYQAIRQHAPDSPTLIFCSSRKQTRLTASDLINYLATESDPKQWLKCSEQDIEMIVANISDPDLRHFLPFGVGIHHAGLQERDRKTVEELFVNQKIQVLIATATLAWGVNFPAHLVIIKGTEYYDGTTKRYVDMPITDILQMMGRAGRPQFDTSGVACVFVHDIKKNFYKKFLYEPFPIESNLLKVLPDHINAEIASGTITTKRNVMEFLTWTYFFRRLLQNPSFYNLPDVDPKSVHEYLSELVDVIIDTLVESNCVSINIEDNNSFYETTFYGYVGSFYYLSHKSLAYFQEHLRPHNTIDDLVLILCHAEEYAVFPVRHNEDLINKDLIRQLQLRHIQEGYDTPYVKVFILLQAHFRNYPLPNQEYIVDLKSVMDQALRILQAILDIVANNGWLSCSLKVINIIQMIIQGHMLDIPSILCLSHITTACLPTLRKEFSLFKISATLPSVVHAYWQSEKNLRNAFTNVLGVNNSTKILKEISSLPLMTVNTTIFEVHKEESETENTGKEAKKTLRKPFDMYAEQEYEFSVSVSRTGSSDLQVQVSKFMKRKEEGWIICLGIQEIDEVLCIKRVVIRRNKVITFKTFAPPRPGRYTFTLYLMSDSYIGLDQQYNFPVNVIS